MEMKLVGESKGISIYCMHFPVYFMKGYNGFFYLTEINFS